MGKSRSRKLEFVGLLLAVAVVSVILAAPTGSAADLAASAEFHGIVLSVNRQARVLNLETRRQMHRRGGVVAIKVSASTRYGDLPGLGAIRRGMRLEVHARRVQGAWVATRIERLRSDSWDWDDDHGWDNDGSDGDSDHGWDDNGMHGWNRG